MKNKPTKIMFKKYVPIALIFVTCALLACFIAALFNAESYFNGEAKDFAGARTIESATLYEERVTRYCSKLERAVKIIAAEAELRPSDEDDEASIERFKVKAKAYIDGKYTGSEYNEDSGSVGHDEILCIYYTVYRGSSDVSKYSTTPTFDFNKLENRYTAVNERVSVSEILTDTTYNGAPRVFAYSVRLDDGNTVWVLCDFERFAEKVMGYETLGELSSYTAITSALDGKVFAYRLEGIDPYDKNGNIKAGQNILEYLDTLTYDSAGEFRNAYTKSESGTFRIAVNTEPYVASFCKIDNVGGGVYLVNIYNQNTLINDEYTTYNSLFGGASGLAVLTILLLVGYIIATRSKRVEDRVLKDTDPLLGCNSYEKFKRVAKDLIATNRATSYAVVCININKFNFVKEKLDSGQINSLLRFGANIINNLIYSDEIYGHILEDSFAVLMHCGDEDAFRDRIRVMNALVNNYDAFKKTLYTVRLNVGAFRVSDGAGLSIQDMLDRAIVAQLSNEKHPTEICIFYDGNIRSAYLREAEIESKMERALKKNEFKVFFQPKYNIKNDRIDSAEALVRWYDSDKKNYVMPDIYIPLFEVNGFIVKLDHYIFDRVCNYLSEATQRGERVVPISVNVSRVTAMQPGFIDFYINKKNAFRIPNDFLVLEFTESFAFENYEAMKKIVISLKNNGFRCSIDDFGSGHSSHNILKELPMDELKLDKFFIAKGDDAFKDETLLAITIRLGKEFNMKVVQEGVETEADLKRLADNGCDIIQGYYYSRPLMMSDFIDFINSDTSLSAVRIALKHKETTVPRDELVSMVDVPDNNASQPEENSQEPTSDNRGESGNGPDGSGN